MRTKAIITDIYTEFRQAKYTIPINIPPYIYVYYKDIVPYSIARSSSIRLLTKETKFYEYLALLIEAKINNIAIEIEHDATKILSVKKM